MIYIQTQNTAWTYDMGCLHNRFASLLMLAFFSICLGCNQEKSSLHESDHEIPPHWPTSMLDSIEKMSHRLDRLQSGDGLGTSLESEGAVATSSTKSTLEELTDLVEWVPEIAAESGLKEPSWDPIYNLCETLRKHLKAQDVQLEFLREDFERLFTMLRSANEEIGAANPPTPVN